MIEDQYSRNTDGSVSGIPIKSVLICNFILHVGSKTLSTMEKSDPTIKNLSQRVDLDRQESGKIGYKVLNIIHFNELLAESGRAFRISGRNVQIS